MTRMLEINNTTKQPINLKTTREIAERFLRVYKKTGFNVSLAIVGAAKIKKLNQTYRGVDKITDVLSFGGGSTGIGGKKTPTADKYLGEVIINIQETKKIWKYRELFKDIGVASYNQEYIFYFLLIHGLLHLVGYNDGTKKERLKMLILGKKFLRGADSREWQKVL